ncbi:aminotransferase class I/II-fold pyridoxal phosphate-dependent enzyme [Actinoplanes aureus]|uniref:8-amino-7-oxononanoate synthase n=1 Tax=Actinoplanes aureus TaxID=2792083 RepID=A0A931CAT1_9ACTN|nr:pyridoxal phosphate-dependent aminotransferase family protein [Actinoplanes aureus]MBG0563693.1 pyridoxal phosphate-dependent aminotransferase family protein [Actinoplanes aureus]
MIVDPFAKGGLHQAEAILKAHGVDAYFRSTATRTGDSHAVIDGRTVMLAGSNDYLGLSTHPAVVEAAVTATRRLGTSVGGSRALTGTLDLHGELEERLATFLGQEAAVVTTTGFQANLALSALLGRSDVAFLDARVHASLIEAARLGWGRVRRYRHLDVAHLRELLAAAPAGSGRLVVTDGMFSMDGDVADLRALREAADEYGAKLVVDAAHDMGVLGSRGAGLAEHCGVEDRVDLITGTFSKAFGSIGGVLAGPASNVRYLRYNARPILFSAALPPASAAAALAALTVIETEPERRTRTLDLAEGLHNGLRALGFDTRPSATPIVPVRFPDLAAAGAFWAGLFRAGVFTNLVAAPAIPAGAMLRLTLTANHDETHLATVLEAVEAVGRRLGVPRRPDLPPVSLARGDGARRAGRR